MRSRQRADNQYFPERILLGAENYHQLETAARKVHELSVACSRPHVFVPRKRCGRESFEITSCHRSKYRDKERKTDSGVMKIYEKLISSMLSNGRTENF